MKQVDPYEELNVNAYGVLKPPLLLWLILLIETGHFLMLLIAVFSKQIWIIATSANWLIFSAQIPALLVLVALGARVPGAHMVFRVIWLRGRELLTLSAIGNVGIIANGVLQELYWRLDSDWASLLLACLHLWVVARLWMSPIIAKVFAEFPKQALK